MSVRFPPPGAGHSRAHHSLANLPLADTLTVIPYRACCCAAKPAVKAVMPATDTRGPVDLWLCGHHWRVSSAALAAAGASVCDLPVPDSAGKANREGAPV
jgi:hypothetical protein